MTDGDVQHELTCGQSGLRVRFRWTGDRFAHVIDRQDRSGAMDQPGDGTLRSVEGHSSEAWPASPAIQQISTERISGAEMIMGVGGSGTSHFSLSVRAVTADEGPPSLHFDWAARLSRSSMDRWLARPAAGHSQPAAGQSAGHSSGGRQGQASGGIEDGGERIRLGSEYAISDRWLVQVDPPARLVELSERRAVAPSSDSSSSASDFSNSDASGFRVAGAVGDERGIRIVAEIRPQERTVRWSYRIGS